MDKGEVREHSDTAAIFLMKTLKPEHYGIGRGQGEGNVTNNLTVNVLSNRDLYNVLSSIASGAKLLPAEPPPPHDGDKLIAQSLCGECTARRNAAQGPCDQHR